jgi:integrase
VCAFAGLRLGEAAGLQLGDVNFLGRTISVRRQVQGSTIKGAAPKYGSERTVYVPDGLLAILSAHVGEQHVTRPDEQVFLTALGRLWNRNNAGEEWRRIREAAGLGEDVTLHALRHTFASNLIAQGCDVVTVQRALGHSQPSITLNVYSHLWPSAEDKTRTATAAFFASVADSADATRTSSEKAQVRSSLYR